MANWTEKKTNMNLTVSVLFPPYCRINRHGRKVADVSIDCKFAGTKGKADLVYKAKCRIFPKKEEVTWEFQSTCCDAISRKVMSLFSYEELCEIFEKMKETNSFNS